MQLSNVILGYFLLAIVIVCVLTFFILYIKDLLKFIFDGADLRVVFLTIFIMLFGCFMHNLYPCVKDGRLNYFIVIFSKFIPIASFWMLLSCKLVGYKALYTNKPFKSASYVVVWAVFFFMAFAGVIILASNPISHKIMVNKGTDAILVNQISELFSYCNASDCSATSIWSIVKFNYYAIYIVGIYLFNKLERRKNTNIELIADILVVIILLLCEIFSDSSIQEAVSLKLGESDLAGLNATLATLYACSIISLFIIEAIDVYNCTKLDGDWKEKMIKEALEDSKSYKNKPYGKKMRAEIEVLANALTEDFIKNPDYFDTLKSIRIKQKDIKFWNALDLELSKREGTKLSNLHIDRMTSEGWN